jgi:hypothetical protein
VTHTPPRQNEPDVPAQQSTSPAHGVRQMAFTHSRPDAQSLAPWHWGRGPTSGWQTPSTQRSAADAHVGPAWQRAWQTPLMHVAEAPQSVS